MKFIKLVTISLVFALSAISINAANDDKKEAQAFWKKFKEAVIKKDKKTLVKMTNFPLLMPFGLEKVRSKKEFYKRYDQIFNDETNAAKCFEKAKLVKSYSNYGVYCGFKDALDHEDKPIFYYFEKTKTGWKFTGLDNINE